MLKGCSHGLTSVSGSSTETNLQIKWLYLGDFLVKTDVLYVSFSIALPSVIKTMFCSGRLLHPLCILYSRKTSDKLGN